MKRGIGISFLMVIFSFAIADNLTLTIRSNEYEIETLEERQEIKMDDFGNLLIPGKPKLPAKIFLIALPPGAEVSSVAVTGLEPTTLPGTYKILPVPLALPLTYPQDKDMMETIKEEWKINYESTYSYDELYPVKVGKYEGSGDLRKYTYVRTSFFPFAYRPKSGKLILYRSALVSIDYTFPSPGSPEARRVESLLSDTLADSRARKLFVNWSQAKWWYLPKNPLKENRLSFQPYSYVIITTTALQSAVSSFVSWKQSIPGHTVRVVTTSWIQSNYSGSDLQEQIRNFLIANYASWGIQYVLLVGDINDIPMRYCYPNPANHSNSYRTPTDYYYADLTGNWDSDGDGYPGEYSQDNVDFTPEVYVGRIPTSDATMVSNICQKLIGFEQDTGDWKSNALLLGAIANFTNENNNGWPKTCGHLLMELMVTNMLSGWTYHRMYEQAGLQPCTQPCDAALTRTNVVNYWSGNDYGIVNWFAHGSQTGAHRKYWSWDGGDGVPEWFEMSSPAFFHSNDCSSLDDDHPSIIFSASCNNGWPENSNCLGRRLLEHGSSGIVSSTRVAWYTVGWNDPGDGYIVSLDYYFFDYLINSNEKVGNALFDSKVYYDNNLLWAWTAQMNMFDFNLYGDPDLYRPGYEPEADIEVVSIDMPGTWGVDPDTVWAGATYQPVATVKNNGPSDARGIEVTATCGDGGGGAYVSSRTIDLTAGSQTQVTFDDWTTDETPCSTYTMRVEATHPDDDNPDNNSKQKQYINLVDITVVSIDVPPDVVLTGTDYIPKATIQNSSPEGFTTFDFFCTIEPGGYASTKPVSHLEYGTQTQVEFDTWTSFLSACSTYTMTVTVDISCDPNPDDNTLDKTIEATGDVGVTIEIVPTDSVFVDTKYFPMVTVTNFTQGMTEAFPCTLIIEDKDAKVIYFAEFVIDGLAPGEERDIIFDEWLVPPEVGELYTLYATSYLPCDDDTDNDMWEWIVKSIARGELDVGVLKINTPSSVKIGEVVKPDATVQNYGELEASFDVICQIESSSNWQVYEDTAEVLALASGDTAKVVFKDWTPEAGSYIMWMKTFLIGDMNAVNDSTLKTVNAVGIEEAEVPDKFDLSCIKPNLMSKQTVISYQLPVVSKVSLAIYDISGKLVKALVSGRLSPGYHTVIWNGKDKANKTVPAGIYFIRLETPDYKGTRKLVLPRSSDKEFCNKKLAEFPL